MWTKRPKTEAFLKKAPVYYTPLCYLSASVASVFKYCGALVHAFVVKGRQNRPGDSHATYNKDATTWSSGVDFTGILYYTRQTEIFSDIIPVESGTIITIWSFEPSYQCKLSHPFGTLAARQERIIILTEKEYRNLLWCFLCPSELNVNLRTFE